MRTPTGGRRLLATAFLPLLVAACGEPTGGAPTRGTSGATPVITEPERANAYPTAEVSGRLTLRGGCLLIGDRVVVWPAGARWDAGARAVAFDDAAPFETARPATVGAVFDGGGAYHPADADPAALLGEDAGARVDTCRGATGAREVVYAYPSVP